MGVGSGMGDLSVIVECLRHSKPTTVGLASVQTLDHSSEKALYLSELTGDGFANLTLDDRRSSH